MARMIATLILLYMTVPLSFHEKWYTQAFTNMYIQGVMLLGILVASHYDPPTGLLIACILLTGILQSRYSRVTDRKEPFRDAVTTEDDAHRIITPSEDIHNAQDMPSKAANNHRVKQQVLYNTTGDGTILGISAYNRYSYDQYLAIA